MNIDTAPIVYFPVSRNPFEFKAGLRKLAPSDHTSTMEDKVFQIDSQWPHYRSEKLKARQEQLHKYVCQHELTPVIRSRISAYFIKQLAREYPQYFHLTVEQKKAKLDCLLSQETLHFNSAMELIDVDNSTTSPAYEDELDALCCQIQEDITINEMTEESDYIRYLHLCFPNYWSARAKLGKNFLNAHLPVPKMQKINAKANNLIDTFMRQGPFERFTWGLLADQRLNHHPDAPAGIDAKHWYGRSFTLDAPSLYFRIERQITLPFPDVKAFVFLIRTYHREITAFSLEELTRLKFSISTMPEQVLAYKGLKNTKNEILQWLDQLILQH